MNEHRTVIAVILGLQCPILAQIDETFVLDHLAKDRLSHSCLLVIDMWQEHWCATLTKNARMLSVEINNFADFFRANGGIVVHAPYMIDLCKCYAKHPAYLNGKQLCGGSQFAERAAQVWKCAFSKYQKPAVCGCKCPDGACVYTSKFSRFINSALRIDESDYIILHMGKLLELNRLKGLEMIFIVGQHINECILHRPLGLVSLALAHQSFCVLEDLVADSFRFACPSHLRTSLFLRIKNCLCPVLFSAQIRRALSCVGV